MIKKALYRLALECGLLLDALDGDTAVEQEHTNRAVHQSGGSCTIHSQAGHQQGTGSAMVVQEGGSGGGGDQRRQKTQIPQRAALCPGNGGLSSEIGTQVVACLPVGIPASNDTEMLKLEYRRLRRYPPQSGVGRWSKGELRRTCRGVVPLVDAVTTELWITLRVGEAPPAKLREPLPRHFPLVRSVAVRSMGTVMRPTERQGPEEVCHLERLLVPPRGASNGLTSLDLSCCWATARLLEASRDITWLALNLRHCAMRMHQHRLVQALLPCRHLRELELHQVEDPGLLAGALAACPFLTSLSLELSVHLPALGSYTASLERIGRLPLRRLHLEGVRDSHSLGLVLRSPRRLCELHLVDCPPYFGTLPAVGAMLTALRSLYFTRCSMLFNVPTCFSQLQALRRLWFTDCIYLTYLPNFVSQLINLDTLVVCCCQSLLLRRNDLLSLTQLRTLQLLYCPQVVLYPESLEGLQNLTYLAMSLRITGLPASLGALSNLQVLDLSDCRFLRELPPSIEHLSKLRKLTLVGCRSLTEMPRCVTRLTDLRELRVSSWKRLQNLEGLGLVRSALVLT